MITIIMMQIAAPLDCYTWSLRQVVSSSTLLLHGFLVFTFVRSQLQFLTLGAAVIGLATCAALQCRPDLFTVATLDVLNHVPQVGLVFAKVLIALRHDFFVRLAKQFDEAGISCLNIATAAPHHRQKELDLRIVRIGLLLEQHHARTR
jgi:hypothetical protein